MKVLIAVIAYNERKNLESVVKDLREHGYEFVVVDNCSTDDTAEYCRNNGINFLKHPVNTGSSFGTVMTYFNYARKLDCDVLCQFDGDGQHIAGELYKIIQPVEKGEADYVIGSRFLEGKGFQSYPLRRLAIKIFAAIDSVVTGKRLTDVTSGFRAYGRNVISFFADYYKHEIIDTNQLLLLSHFSGARLAEVPVEMRGRVHGRSEFRFLNALLFPVKGMMNIFGCLLQKKQIVKYKGELWDSK
ncbi:MAG TPA: glycosyltransferase family 2 protein [Ignavibacteria bacterium]|nr:glycosyltransferase family 2 protein [Ignavibacteria bacterium]